MPAMSKRARGLLIGAAVALAAGCAALALDLGVPAAWTAAITGLCAAWWVLEPVPIPVTSLVPFGAFPMVGVLDHRQVAASYGHTMILLLMGGFMLSTAVEHSGVHRRLALGMVRAAGGGSRRLVLGFMIASAVCSMWISNTATTLMLLPVAMAVVRSSRGAGGTDELLEQRATIPLLLGIAYAASIGGMATPIGTPPNVIFMGIYERETGSAISFLEWMKIGLPAVCVLIPITWLYLTRRLGGVRAPELPALGAWTSAEKRVLVVFAITAAAWIFRAEPLGGWGELLGAEGAGDSTVALVAVVVLCLVPDGEGGHLMDWDTAKTIPWGLLLLFGGGLAISAGFKASGLSEALGHALGGIADWPTVALTAIICVSVTFLTEVTSNTATTNLLMPVLIAAASAAAVEPMRLMVPATLSASCAFMLPVATAPNAIVSSGGVPTARMAREGIVLNFVGAMALTTVCSLVL
jgi:sodium-dependent dicarboxylate transporter 2/3/5